jgi:hypothetical protein
MKNNIKKLFGVGLAIMSFVVIGSPMITSASTLWDTTGNYVINMNYLGNDYSHDMSLTQDSTNNLTGNGGSPAGANVYTWTITSGTVNGALIDLFANYTATADAVTPLTTMHVTGTIADDGTVSGEWSDNYQSAPRSGTWSSVTGIASVKPAVLSAEDFGVVNYDTGLGLIKGYTAGFGLENDTFDGSKSVVVKLYSGSTLLQTNTAILAKFNADITGTQFSSPFDVSGTFDYVTDGYWTNVREVQYGQSIPATKVVATVTLENDQVVTAENLLLTGDPTTIYPLPPVTPVLTDKNLCKKGGWKTFTNPSFKNQGQCVSYIQSNAKAGKRN